MAQLNCDKTWQTSMEFQIDNVCLALAIMNYEGGEINTSESILEEGRIKTNGENSVMADDRHIQGFRVNKFKDWILD